MVKRGRPRAGERLVPITMALPVSTLNGLEGFAEELRRPRVWVVRMALESYILTNSKNGRKLLGIDNA